MANRSRKTFADSVRLPPEGGVVTRAVESARTPGIVSIRIGRSGTIHLPAPAAAAIGLREGSPWSAEARARVLDVLVEVRAREFALRIAAGRALTRRQVQDKLSQRGLPFARARSIVEELAARGVIDEAALARHVADVEISRRKSGKSLVIAKLRRRGVAQETAQRATDSALTDSGLDQFEVARVLAHKKARSIPAGLDRRAAERRLYGFLARRGFDPDACAKATREALKEAIPRDPSE